MRHKSQNKIRHFVRTHRTLSMITAIIVLTGIYIFWSVNAWANYTTTTERWKTTLREETDAALALPVSSSDERTKKINTLRQVADTIESQSGLCHVPTLLRWQENLQAVKEKQQVCNQFTEKAASFSADLQKLTEYLETDQQLTNIMVTAAAKKTLAEADLEAQVHMWQRAAQDVQSMQVQETSAPVKDVAVQSAKTIYEAWQKLYDAHKAEDAAAYDEARREIAGAYDTIAGVAAESTRQFKTLANSLQATYDAL